MGKESRCFACYLKIARGVRRKGKTHRGPWKPSPWQDQKQIRKGAAPTTVQSVETKVLCVSSGAHTPTHQPFLSFFTRSGRDSRLTDIRWDVKLLVDPGYMCAPERQPLPAGSDVAASGTTALPVAVHICRTRAAATALSWDASPARFHSLTVCSSVSRLLSKGPVLHKSISESPASHLNPSWRVTSSTSSSVWLKECWPGLLGRSC